MALDIGTDKVDQETATGIIVFIENAFVNIGTVKVVDRAHIEDIFEEMEFQMSGAIDENTAFEVGKLSGSDIIVIGSINRVGGLFYLNTKLIAVETAEFICSSIAQADSASGCLDMANQAVYKLFRIPLHPIAFTDVIPDDRCHRRKDDESDRTGRLRISGSAANDGYEQT